MKGCSMVHQSSHGLKCVAMCREMATVPELLQPKARRTLFGLALNGRDNSAIDQPSTSRKVHMSPHANPYEV
jgi:hypothetical protein